MDGFLNIKSVISMFLNSLLNGKREVKGTKKQYF